MELLRYYYYTDFAFTPNMARYFYHPDHLGSSSWITDNTGRPIQHLHYLPFGEDWVDQRNSSWNAPYTFSSKEKDVETGYGYFGARYYDSGLSIWLSVDPMSDKYPSLSPYNYCANNPVILVDPDGKDIYIFNLDGTYSGNKIIQDGEHTGRIVGEDGKAVKNFKFSDPIEDSKAIDNGTITKVVWVSEKKIGNILGKVGALSKENRKNAMTFMKEKSTGGQSLDFSISSIPYEFPGASYYPFDKPSSMLFLPEKTNTAYNHLNFGNFLWGAAGASLRIDHLILSLGAQYNSLFNSETNKYPSQLDSHDDQNAISDGYNFAMQHSYYKRTWSESSGISPKKR